MNMERITLVIAVIGCITAFFCMAGCVQQTPEEGGQPSPEPLSVAVTIPPQKQFVERIGADHVEVMVLVPPGASPHTHEPTPGQLAEIAGADMYVMVGSGIEFERAWMDKLTAVNPGMLIVDSSGGIDLIAPGGGWNGVDPHIWLSPKNAIIMVEHVYHGLAQLDPVHESLYRANRDHYQQELVMLDAEIREALADNADRKIMVYHPSWAYFARDYGLEQIPIEEEGKEPTPQGIQHLIDQAREHNISIIFASPEYSLQSAEVIAAEINGKVVLVSPLEEDYLGNMRTVAYAFAEE